MNRGCSLCKWQSQLLLGLSTQLHCSLLWAQTTCGCNHVMV